ncbi:CobW C-terminal domain-containing protein [Paraburkholderia sp. RL17-337-BIB-A]|uniref:GTP-binding protein n=1 Tax=Paraburkholderia sp. RL17-337-BIB-A TaxID=3031636 RepID=UPI0038BC4AB5
MDAPRRFPVFLASAPAFAFEMSSLNVASTCSRGERILRVKGIGNFIGEQRPVVFHGVQQLLHEPLRLKAWPDDAHTTWLAFIVQGLARSVIEETIAYFLREAA